MKTTILTFPQTLNTLKSVLILEKDYQVDFNHQNSLAKVLRFTGAKYTGEFHESENVVNILRYDFGKLRKWNDEKHYLLFFSESQPQI